MLNIYQVRIFLYPIQINQSFLFTCKSLNLLIEICIKRKGYEVNTMSEC